MNAISENFQHKYGFGIDAAHVSTVQLDVMDMNAKDRLSYFRCPASKVHDKLAKMVPKAEDVLLCNLTGSESSFEQMFKLLSESLFGNDICSI